MGFAFMFGHDNRGMITFCMPSFRLQGAHLSGERITATVRTEYGIYEFLSCMAVADNKVVCVLVRPTTRPKNAVWLSIGYLCDASVLPYMTQEALTMAFAALRERDGHCLAMGKSHFGLGPNATMLEKIAAVSRDREDVLDALSGIIKDFDPSAFMNVVRR
jgi:hypothetical protein